LYHFGPTASPPPEAKKRAIPRTPPGESAHPGPVVAPGAGSGTLPDHATREEIGMSDGEWSRRPESDTPKAEQRDVRDDEGRAWIGTVTSGTLAGGEAHAEVVWVCRDTPSEAKRVSRLDTPAAEADEAWRGMSDDDARGVFRRSEVRTAG
jgi:hypothetical protein